MTCLQCNLLQCFLVRKDRVRFSPLTVITVSVQSFRKEVSMFIVPTIPCFPATFLQPL